MKSKIFSKKRSIRYWVHSVSQQKVYTKKIANYFINNLWTVDY